MITMRSGRAFVVDFGFQEEEQHELTRHGMININQNLLKSDERAREINFLAIFHFIIAYDGRLICEINFSLTQHSPLN